MSLERWPPSAALGGKPAREDNAFMPRGKLDPASVRVRVSCTACGREFRATPQRDGSLVPSREGSDCDCGATLTPHYTARQLDQMHRLREENPDASY
jgi:hypothetical protein